MLPDAVDAADRVHHGGDPDRDLLEFSANVNPRRPDGVDAVYDRALSTATRYPDDDYPAFREAAAGALERDAARTDRELDEPGISPSTIVPTPGGLAAIRLAMATTLTEGDRVLLPKPSFAEYAREVELQGATPTFVPHDAIVDDIVDGAPVELSAYAMVVVCNPNNPTGDAVDARALRELAERCRMTDTVLLVDEAFLGFTAEPSIAGTPGVVVARSLTKLYGLPGLRAGYAVATDQALSRLQTARRAWNLGTPAAAVGTHCLRDDAFVAQTRERIATERDRLVDSLADGLPADVIPHDGVAPFVLLEVGNRDPQRVVAGCRDRGVAVRDATTFRDLDSHIRVAVRSREANDDLVATLQEVLA